jgi:hypothetical protein
LPDGAIAFVDLFDQKIRLYRDGAVRGICTVKGSPNGMRLGPDGALYLANNGGLSPRRGGRPEVVEPQISGRLQRVTQEGAVSDVAVNLPGEAPCRHVEQGGRLARFVLSHYHAVRVVGASAYRGAEIIASAVTRDMIVERGQQDMDSEIG